MPPATLVEISDVSLKEKGVGHKISALGGKGPGSKVPDRTSSTKEALPAALWRRTAPGTSNATTSISTSLCSASSPMAQLEPKTAGFAQALALPSNHHCKGESAPDVLAASSNICCACVLIWPWLHKLGG